MPNARPKQLALGGALGLIALATLWPASGSSGGWQSTLPDAADLLLNLVLYVPLGLALRGRTIPAARACLMMASLSALIELAQLTVIPGRAASPWDLGSNFLGGWAGMSLPPLLLALPPLALWVVSPLLLAPAAPPAVRWWGQWAHHFPGSAAFRGTVQQVEFNGLATPDDQLSEPTTTVLRRGYSSPPITLRVEFHPDSGALGLRHLASIADGRGQAIAAIWLRGTAIETSWHARGTGFGLRTPAVRTDRALASLPNGATTLLAAIGHGQAQLTVAQSMPGHRSVLWLGPWEGWRLFWPLPPPAPAFAWIMAVAWTAACLGVPAAAWRSRARGRHEVPPTLS